MTQLFSAYLQAGFFSSVMILAVLLLRPLLRKAPRNTLCILWLLVALRLLLPFQLESSLSLQPRYTPAAHTQAQIQLSQPSTSEPVYAVPNQNIQMAPTVSEPLISSPTEPLPQTTPMPSASVVPEKAEVDLTAIVGGIWIGGIAAVMLYTAIAYRIIRRRVRDAIPSGHNIWESHRIPGAFLLGYLKPRIYLPEGLHPQDRDFMIAHEQTHIRRRDNWWKLLGMICVAFHWYNPLVWLSYWLLCRDIEVACDQRVIQDMSLKERKAYSFALLSSGKRMSHIIAYPVTFGEVNLKQRIKHVLSYRKPGFWITLVSAILVLAVGVCFLTIPKDTPEAPSTSLQETEPTEPPVTQQIETEPAETQPEETEPTETQPEETAPTETQPKETEPVKTEPVETEPTETEPEETEPTETEPEVTEPTETQPEETEPTETQPEVTEPTETQPEVTEPTETQPEVTEPTETQPEETEPTETQPEVTEPTETEPEETQSTEPALQNPDDDPVAGDDWHGSHMRWQLAKDGTLTFYGNGGIPAFRPYGWMDYSNQITKIHIADGITSIPKEAFSGLSNVTTVSLSSTLETIGENAFSYCTSLQSIAIGDSVTEIDEVAFQYCTNLHTVTFSDHSQVHTIGAGAFRGTALTQFRAPANLTLIDDFAFADCLRLETVVLDGKVQRVKKNAFDGCSGIKHIVLGAALGWSEEYFSQSFAIETAQIYTPYFTGLPNRSALKSVTIGGSITEIGYGWFEGCTSLSQVTITAPITEVGAVAFRDCKSLTTIDLPNTVTRIFGLAFDGSGLTSITLPSSIDRLYNQIFCNIFRGRYGKLAEITFTGDAPAIEADTFEGIIATVYYPADNASWSDDKLQNYGGKITWVPI